MSLFTAALFHASPEVGLLASIEVGLAASLQSRHSFRHDNKRIISVDLIILYTTDEFIVLRRVERLVYQLHSIRVKNLELLLVLIIRNDPRTMLPFNGRIILVHLFFYSKKVLM